MQLARGLLAVRSDSGSDDEQLPGTAVGPPAKRLRADLPPQKGSHDPDRRFRLPDPGVQRPSRSSDHHLPHPEQPSHRQRSSAPQLTRQESPRTHNKSSSLPSAAVHKDREQPHKLAAAFARDSGSRRTGNRSQAGLTHPSLPQQGDLTTRTLSRLEQPAGQGVPHPAAVPKITMPRALDPPTGSFSAPSQALHREIPRMAGTATASRMTSDREKSAPSQAIAKPSFYPPIHTEGTSISAHAQRRAGGIGVILKPVVSAKAVGQPDAGDGILDGHALLGERPVQREMARTAVDHVEKTVYQISDVVSTVKQGPRVALTPKSISQEELEQACQVRNLLHPRCITPPSPPQLSSFSYCHDLLCVTSINPTMTPSLCRHSDDF